MTKQETAVEWLIKNLTYQPSSGYYTVNGLNVTDVIKKAKEMDKQFLNDIDSDLAIIEDYAKGEAGEAITQLRKKLQKIIHDEP